MKPVGTHKPTVAFSAVMCVHVEFYIRLCAHSPRNIISHRMTGGLFFSKYAFPNHIGYHGMIIGDLCQHTVPE